MELTTSSADHPWATVGTGKGADYLWLDQEADILDAWGRHLPHWRQPGTVYFVTFRTADSIPAAVLTEWKKERLTWLAKNPPPHDESTLLEYDKRFTRREHRYLDDCRGACPLRNAAAREIVVDALRKLDGAEDGYALDAFVVMPNHVHVLVSPLGRARLSAIGRAWKSVTAHRINELLGRRGMLWQHESWDHIVRSPLHLDRFRRYIRENPRDLPSTIPSPDHTSPR